MGNPLQTPELCPDVCRFPYFGLFVELDGAHAAPMPFSLSVLDMRSKIKNGEWSGQRATSVMPETGQSTFQIPTVWQTLPAAQASPWF